MTRRHNHPQRGFTLVELLIATGLTITVIGAAVLVFTQSVQTSNLTLKCRPKPARPSAKLPEIFLRPVPPCR
jgi:type II secretory pathway component PulJ